MRTDRAGGDVPDQGDENGGHLKSIVYAILAVCFIVGVALFMFTHDSVPLQIVSLCLTLPACHHLKSDADRGIKSATYRVANHVRTERISDDVYLGLGNCVAKFVDDGFSGPKPRRYQNGVARMRDQS
jgi:hypothetical protein